MRQADDARTLPQTRSSTAGDDDAVRQRERLIDIHLFRQGIGRMAQ